MSFEDDILAVDAELAAVERELRLDLAQAALDAAGIADPTPASDAVGAALSLYRSDYSGALFSALSIIPYLGDAIGKTAKGAKLLNKIKKGQKAFEDLLIRRKVLKAAKEAADKAAAAMKTVVSFTDEYVKLSCGKVVKRYTAQPLPMPKGRRPSPRNYTTPEFRAAHREEFKNGVVKIVNRQKAFNPDYKGTVGPPGEQHFVMPKDRVEKLIKEANGSVEKLENLLGLKRGDLGDNPALIEVKSHKNFGLPSGNEQGANTKWIPGGFTSGSVPEAVIDQLQPGEYAVFDVFK